MQGLFSQLLAGLTALAISTLADTTPPIVSLNCPAAGGTYRTSNPTLHFLSGMATDDTGIDYILWSSDRGGGGTVCTTACSTFDVYRIALAEGDNAITVTAYDQTGNSGLATIVIRRETSPGTMHVDCSLAASGDGTESSPFNKLQEALDLASTGDTIHLAGEACHQAVRIEKGISIHGDPSRPHAVVDGTQACTYHLTFSPVTIATDQPVVLKHLSPSSIGLGSAFGDEPSSHVLLDDIIDSSVFLRTSLYPLMSETTIINSDLLSLATGAQDVIAKVLVRDSRVASAQLYGSPLVLDLTLERTEVSNLSMTHEGIIAANIRDSVLHGGIHAGGLDTYRLQVSITDSIIDGGSIDLSGGFTAGTSLDVSLTRNVIRGSPISIFHRDDAGSYSDQSSPVTITLQDNLLESSPARTWLFRSGRVLRASPREISFRNNVARGGGFQVDLDDGNFDDLHRDDSTVMQAVNNTIVAAPIGVGITAVNTHGPLPPWRLDVLNNIVVGGQTGLSLTGAAFLDLRIAHNDAYGNSGADYDGELSDQTGFNGNIAADPMFADPSTGDFTLQSMSPCIDSGLTDPAVPGADAAGTPRPQDGDGDGLALPDIGAFEFVQHDEDHDGYPIPLDCDDGDPSVYPAAVELPGNSVDENCDSVLACNPSSFWKSHGQFIQCVARGCGSLVAGGQLDQATCDALITQAAASQVGRRAKRRAPTHPAEP